ncbi:MAG: radical SAM protein [Deltaproteobacteria bacterium]|nr:radical SAM protein [Deltaproteobacteria bacterium]
MGDWGTRKSLQPSVRVALVGRERPDDENLALRYLAAALVKAGHRPLIVPLCGPDDLLPASDAILGVRPPLVGLSIPDADAAIDAFALARYVRRAGYGGHITCGGALATLVRHEFLARHPELDSVVRHDGEEPVCKLAARLGVGQDWKDVAGVTSRAGDGQPANVADRTPLLLRPLRRESLPELLGVPVARLLASRGCPGRCAYCGPAALQRQAVEEGLRSGLDRESMCRAGVGGTRRRAPAEVAAEVADLYHLRGVRFFHVLDDNLLSGQEALARPWLEDLLRELGRHKVGRCAWGLQVEPRVLTPTIERLLRRLGVVRLNVGLESATEEQLAALGRPGRLVPLRAAVERLRDEGVVVFFNSLIVHPASTAQGMAAELDALDTLRGLHFDAITTAVFPRTALHEKLCREGKVSGGSLGMRFEPDDPVVACFRAALIRLRLHGAGRAGVSVLAHDVALNLALARHLRLPGWNAHLDAEARSALDEMNRVRVQSWRAALALAETEMEPHRREQAVAWLVAALQRDPGPSWNRFAHIQNRLPAGSLAPAGRPSLFVTSTLAAGFTFYLAVAGISCVGSSDGDGGTTGGGSDAPVLTMPDAPTSVPIRTYPPDTGRSIDGPSLNPETGLACTTSEIASDRDRVNALAGAASCPQCYGVAIDGQGRVVDVISADGTPVADDVRSCYLQALAAEAFPCLSGDTAWRECMVCMW